jgi:hypothetical protein
MSLILLNNLQILNLNCQTIRISWGSSVAMTVNVRALRSVGYFINVAPGDESPIEKLKYKICTEAK